MFSFQKPVFEKKHTKYGSFWCARDNKYRLLDCLRSIVKSASLGGEQESSFEQAFASLGYAYLKDKCPRFLDYVVGFQLVDRNEDNTKAVGIFGAKVADQWFNVPIFFLNGDLKGHELLYIKRQDTFVPLKESWFNYVIARKPHSLGETSEKDVQSLGALAPNLLRLLKNPSTKQGEDLFSQNPWSVDFLTLCSAFQLKQARALYPELIKTAAPLHMEAVIRDPLSAALSIDNVNFNLENFLTHHPSLLKFAFDECYLKYPAIKIGFDRFYGDTMFESLGRCYRPVYDNLVYLAKSDPLLVKSADYSPFYYSPGKPWELEICPIKQGELEIYAFDTQDVPGARKPNRREILNDEERQKLAKDNVLIRDKRERKSIAYNYEERDVSVRLSNPTHSGMYKVLDKYRGLVSCLVLVHPYTDRGRENFCTVIPQEDTCPGNYDTQLFSAGEEAPERLRKYLNSKERLDSLQEGKTYVLVDPDLEDATAPFTVKHKLDEDAYEVSWHRQKSYQNLRRSFYAQYNDYDWNRRTAVRINRNKGARIRLINGELFVPSDYKVIAVPDLLKEDKDELIPGDAGDAVRFMKKQASELSIQYSANRYLVRYADHVSRPLTKAAALVHLVRDHGLDEDQARLMLYQAERGEILQKQAAFLIVHAEGYPLEKSALAPAFPPPNMGAETLGRYGTIPAIYPQEANLPIDELSSANTDPRVYDPYYKPDPRIMQIAQQAALSGQKEVFDTTMIAGLLKAVRQSTLIDRYLGDLMKALDRLGRILFMFYWHQEEFEDRYGKHDLPELEDSIRNAFEVLGDVCLFLKEKDVKGRLDMMSGVGTATGPNVDEAAGN